MVENRLENSLYDKGFFEHVTATSSGSAAAIVRWLVNAAKPASVLDIGCGEGAWLAEFQSQGVVDCIGVDGSYVDVNRLKIDLANFHASDLIYPLDLSRKFDLTICLEVAEHLSEANSTTIVSSIVRHSNAVLFSAAVPHQQGTDHRNEQWPAYWIRLFSESGYECFDVVRPRFWQDSAVALWYQQNAMIFIRRSEGFANFLADAISPYETMHGMAVIHPSMWELRYQETVAHADNISLRSLVGKLPKAALRAITKRCACISNLKG